MPTSLARLGREKKMSTLAKRIFVIEGPNSRELQRRAERALLRANPSLADPESFKPGAVILVPSGTGLVTTDRVSVVSADVNGALEETSIRIQMSAQLVQDSFARSAEDDEKTIALLGDRSFGAKLRKALPEGAEIIAQTAKTLKETTAANQKNRAQFDQAFKMALEEIDQLKRLAKRNNQ